MLLTVLRRWPLCFSISFNTVIISLGEEEAGLCVVVVLCVCVFFLFFVLFCFVCFCFLSFWRFFASVSLCDCGTPWTFLLTCLRLEIMRDWKNYHCNTRRTGPCSHICGFSNSAFLFCFI